MKIGSQIENQHFRGGTVCFVNPWAFVQEAFRKPKSDDHHVEVSLDVMSLITTDDQRIIKRDQEGNRVTVEERLISKIKRSVMPARHFLEQHEAAVYQVKLRLTDSIRLPVHWLTSNTLSPELQLNLPYIEKRLEGELGKKELKMGLSTYGGNVKADQPIILEVQLVDDTPDD